MLQSAAMFDASSLAEMFPAQSGSIPYAELSYLVIEDSQTMRTWLRNAIAEAGGVKIDMADSYFDALNRIKNKGNYDIVLCDYILSDTRDGQQLLEEVRRNRLLPQSTLWIMITGEQKYEQVFSAAELAPDDYLIKPITPALLGERMMQAWERRNTLKVATQLFDGEAYREALEVCQKRVAAKSRFALGFQRIAGECLLALGKYKEAHDHYESLLESFPRLPWARLGKARAYFHMDRQDETREILEDMIHSNPDFLQAHDLLAKVHERTGNLEQSRELLKVVLQKNPKALHRHREIVRVAMATGDSQTAVEAFALMHQHGRGSTFLRPGDFCEYAGLLMSSGSKAAKERLDTLGSALRDFHRDDADFVFSAHMVAYAGAKASNKPEDAKNAYARMRQAMECSITDQTNIDTSEYMAMLAASTEMNDMAMIERCALALYTDHVGNNSMLNRINEALEKAGLSSKAEAWQAKATESLHKLNMEAVNLAKHGKLKEAILEFVRLAESNRSISVYLNAALAIIKMYEEVHAGKLAASAQENRQFSQLIVRCAEYVRMHDPGNVKIEKIMAEWGVLAKKMRL